MNFRHMTAAILGTAVLMSSATPALAAKASKDENALVALYAPTLSAPSSSAAASDQIVPTREFYSSMLDYVQAQVAYNGAVYDAFRTVGLSGSALDQLAQAQARLTNASLSIITYLQGVVSPA